MSETKNFFPCLPPFKHGSANDVLGSIPFSLSI